MLPISLLAVDSELAYMYTGGGGCHHVKPLKIASQQLGFDM